MAKVKIGGEEIELPDMSVRVMRLVLPMVEELEAASRDGGGEGAAEVNKLLGISMRIVGTWLYPPPMWEPGTEATEDPRPLPAERREAWIARKAAEVEDRMTAAEANALGPAIREALEAQGMERGESPAGAAVTAPPTPSRSGSTKSSRNSRRRA